MVEGDRLWYVNNRCEVVCFDIGPLKRGSGEPREVWNVDMRKQFGVFPRVMVMMGGGGAAVAGCGDLLYVVTHNGVDEGVNIPSPDAPSLLCLVKATGKLVWKDNSPGKNILHTQFSSPLACTVLGRTQVIVGQGDGWVRSFESTTGKLLWKCDLNPKDSEYNFGSGNRNYILATPVLYDGLVYLATGQDVEHASGVGGLYCIDPTKHGDVSRELEDGPKKGKPNPNSAVVWYTPPTVPDDAPRILVPRKNKSVDLLRDRRDYYFGRSISSATAHDGLLYAAELDGYFYCFDAKTGKLHWFDDLRSSVWGQPLWADGKVYIGTDEGAVVVYAHGKVKNRLAKIPADHPIRAGLVFTNRTLYIPTESMLYAIREPNEVTCAPMPACADSRPRRLFLGRRR
jgi:outer membrane protein assembly factor BamB